MYLLHIFASFSENLSVFDEPKSDIGSRTKKQLGEKANFLFNWILWENKALLPKAKMIEIATTEKLEEKYADVLHPPGVELKFDFQK